MNITRVIGQTAKFSAKIFSQAEYGIQWLRHDRDELNVTIVVKSRTTNIDLYHDPNVLVLENVTFSDEGWYTCQVGNSVGRATSSAYLRVIEEPTVVVEERVAQRSSSIFENPIAIASIVVLGFIVLALGFMKVHSDHKQRRMDRDEKNKPKYWTKQVIIEKRQCDDNQEGAILIPEVNIKNVVSNKFGQEYELPLDITWEFPREKLTLGKKLGEGAFGEVVHGQISDSPEKGDVTTVAVKRLKVTHTDAEMIDLISEMETMKELGRHVNIINLIGCCTQTGELLVIMEFAEQGNLKDYLRKYRHQFVYGKPEHTLIPMDELSIPPPQEELTFEDLMSFAYQVARGMAFLSHKKYVHRDLAARNILVCGDKVVKIGDFGMTRSTFTSDYYRKRSDGRVPIRWMAPETLFHLVYTSQSDVWSYGILLWEIVTLGCTPYPDVVDSNKVLLMLKNGQRMEKPSNCPDELYNIMSDCWMEHSTSRPTFEDLVGDIGRILHIASGAEYMNMEGVRPFENIETPPSSPETSMDGFIFDPDFLKTFCSP
jgi:serine/threonine protein kinase